MKYSLDDMLNETCLYTLTVYGKINGEIHESRFQLISRLCIIPLCNAFESHLINMLKKDGTFDYNEVFYVHVDDRKPL